MQLVHASYAASALVSAVTAVLTFATTQCFHTLDVDR
jgi:hypothetical protein